MSFEFLRKPISQLSLKDDGEELVAMVWVLTAVGFVLLEIFWNSLR